MTETPTIHGYDYGTDAVAHSPVTIEELRQLEATVGLAAEDRGYLAMAGGVLTDQAEAMVAAWREKIGAQQHLAKWFYGPSAKPDEHYKSAVKPRFVQWVIDLCTRPYDQAWLDYQEEIGLRHTPAKKNLADRAQTPELVPWRYLLAFTAIVVTTARDFLGRKGHSAGEVERMHEAWTKAVLLSVTLWSRPYARNGLW